MRRILFMLLAFVLVFGVVAAFAGEGCGDKAATKAAGATNAKACCAGKANAASASNAMSVDKAAAEAGHVCPDVVGRTVLTNFHENMHPMHMAVKESNFDQLREKLPALVEASKAVADYKCDGYEKCSDACRKNFDGKKGELLESVNNLKEACKGQDNEKVAAAFDVMHEAYISFASTCAHPEEKPAEDHSSHDNQ